MYNKSDSIKFHTLGVIAHEKKRDKSKIYALPSIEEWTEEFCSSLNKINYDKKIKFSINDNLKESTDNEIKKTFEAFSHIVKVKVIYIYQNIPVNFIRFTDTVILKKENVACAKACAESITQGLSLLQSFNSKRDYILEKCTMPLTNKEDTVKHCKLIEEICALQSHFTADNKRSFIGSDNYIFNELLQNANDRINDGKIDIEINDTELILSYNEDGFSAKDFLAISTSGNSGNVDNTNQNNDNMDATGHKGTGFKSVYNVFKKVVVRSGHVTCILDDSKKAVCYFNGDKISKINYTDWNGDKRYFPVPKFDISEQSQERTTITLSFISNERRNEFIKNNRLYSADNFKDGTVYYFLDKISKFTIKNNELDKGEGLFDKNTYLYENFYKFDEFFEVSKEELVLNPRWENKAIDEFNNSSKNKIVILFPKNNLPSETSAYCTLPVANKKIKIPFYMNCPAFELEDGRNNISDNDNVKEWNDIIWEKAIRGSGSAFSKIFKEFAEKNPDIAYKYFPYDYIDEWQCLKEISFIKTITGDVNNYKLMAMNQWYSELPNNNQQALEEEYKKGFVFLPDYMYEWFAEKKGVDGFSCNVPFVYYGFEFDYNDFRHEKLYEAEEVKNISMELFQVDDKSVGKILLDIKDFFFSKYYVERKEVIREKFEIDFLKELHKTHYFNFELQKQFCYQWYLGKTICESPSHCLNGVSLGGYSNVLEYENKVFAFFESINPEQFKSCYIKLREQLYIKEDGNVVDVNDNFLNKVLDQYRNSLDIISQFSDELNDDNLNDKRKELFDSGKIAVKLGNDSFCLLKNVENLFISSIITNKPFILSEPEWAKKYVSNLDQELEKITFYENVDEKFLKSIVPAYLESWNYARRNSIVYKIRDYIEKCEDIRDKQKYLFTQICKMNSDAIEFVLIDWKNNYFDFIENYNEQIQVNNNDISFNSKVRFSFDDEKLAVIPKYIKDKFNDRVDQKEKEKEVIFLGESLSLGKILEDKVWICNDKYKNTRRYCIGSMNYGEDNSQNVIIVFGEESIGKMLSDLFKCKSYITPGAYKSMNCYLPNPLFKPNYDYWNKDILGKIEITKYADDKELKNLLLQRFEVKINDEWFCFKGYGSGNFKSKCCPICGGIMIAEASSLHIRYIQAVQGIHVPILVCSNCNEAVKYSENVYFCNDEGNEYLTDSKNNLLDLLKSTNEIKISFDMFSNERKEFLLNMTLFHRLICINLLEER